MAKRRRSPLSDDQDWSEGDISHALTDSELEDASFGRHPNSSSSRKKVMTRKGAKVPKIDASSISNTEISSHTRSSHVISQAGSMRTALLGWYATVHTSRGMPWRKPYDPTLGQSERAQRAYEVWISEIMLQQTQVVTVIPYYNRWIERFPTIHALAVASIDEVNALWKGLGYYSRASRLLAGAQKAVEQYGGRLPDNAKTMEANIPGIGRYSAGAICSIAYGEKVPVLDGNVHRLMSRLLRLYATPKSKATLDILWEGARVMVDTDTEIEAVGSTGTAATGSEPPQYPGDINQALIELGSTVCKVREPKCESCPLQAWCGAYHLCTGAKLEGTQGESLTQITDIEDLCKLCETIPVSQGVTIFPMKVDRKRAKEEIDIVHVIEWRSQSKPTDRRFLMTRRPEGGLLAGLYDFPTSVNVSGSPNAEKREGLVKEILSLVLTDSALFSKTKRKRTGIEGEQSHDQVAISTIRPASDVIHVFSHIRKTYKPQWVVIEGTDNPPSLSTSLSDVTPARKGRRSTASKGKPVQLQQNTLDLVDDANRIDDAIWVPLHEVMQTNMGTGVAKVWNITKKLWEGPVDDDR